MQLAKLCILVGVFLVSSAVKADIGIMLTLIQLIKPRVAHSVIRPKVISADKLLVITQPYNKLSYKNQLIFIDTRALKKEKKMLVADKILEFGNSIGDEGLIIVPEIPPAESKRVLAKILDHWDLKTSKYLPSGGPYLIGHVGIAKDADGNPVGRPHITDFSGMNPECMLGYIEDIEWSIITENIDSDEAANHWAVRSLICEGSKIVSEGYDKSIEEAYRYFSAWTR